MLTTPSLTGLKDDSHKIYYGTLAVAVVFARSFTKAHDPRIDTVYIEDMTKLLEIAVDRVRALPPDQQDEFARVLLRLAGDDEPIYHLTPEDEASLSRSLQEAERGEFATDDEVRAIWAKYDL